ncbi:putative radical SAM protein YgiQ [Clostridium saccharoperbutylacetonicum]|uniref:Radical SAM domain-containing protein n=1 Tax=Clostridium saccharoperbutylacetonicum N1-4(HMT) TaxID=931276 RepID=M1MJ63_9CLOT|nr:YgiQ family radical SAM protein [Clostridium saccharoperbutylacetonicum]AGF57979.1 radical SAM domain-containing protein [Clostridium saccharoperbutylacetonicum N1-4(HMT)]NRT61248.1 putative radical SAM protein YgiQ [Clostridium saccharoperbutylacetonicum]NSB24565.1 putative radical SAM protein YgiQ [Clostridium saccharoperbutylacetonicum]NSB43940.1 putative radical SAM protein YgiQ [Clostridium saccharoperbutylacetonicum]
MTTEKKFVPINKKDMRERGWDECDFIIVTADAYIDHHSFGTAIISRVLEANGYKVGIIAQPDWKSIYDFQRLGRPKYAFLVNAGNMDSMVNHYTVSKRERSADLYSPGGEMGHRPDMSTIVYCNKIREAYKDIDIVIGGIEASLRRFAHYDYWSDKVRKSILIDSTADLLIYSMGEKQIVAIAESLKNNVRAKDITYVRGTCYLTESLEDIQDYIEIPSYKDVSIDKYKYAQASKLEDDEQDSIRGHILVQKHGNKYLVQNIPETPLNREELDEVYNLPYMRNYHPIYEAKGGIPAIEEVKFSTVSSRGCFGDCKFCAITFHQGRVVQSRSKESILQEVEEITKMPDFKGYIHDVGGPTANFRKPACTKQLAFGACKGKDCLSPSVCGNADVDHSEYLELLRAIRKVPKVKKAFVRSGLRYDYIMADKDDTFFKELVEHHVSGKLKVAPEHVSRDVLKYMGKPAGETYDKFVAKFEKITNKLGKKQYIIPYLMSSHPGSTLKCAIELAEYLRDINYQPEQVQDFYPTPGTLATTMYYTGLDPATMKEIYVPKTKHEKAMQRALLQFKNPKYYTLVYEALTEAGRTDLIGNGPKCLIRDKSHNSKNNSYSKSKESNTVDKSNKTNANRGNKGKQISDNHKSRNTKGKNNAKTTAKHKSRSRQ